MAVDHQPARAFGNPHPHHEHDQAEHGAGEIGEPPAEIGSGDCRIEQHDRGCCAERGADPEAAVDDEIGPAAIARRHQLLDGGVDRGVFAADARTGEKTKQRVARDIPRQRGGGGRREIDRERDEEQFLAADAIGEPAEADRAEHGAGKIERVGEADVEIGEMHASGLCFQRARQRAGERHLEPVENPGDAERQHHAGVEAAPGQRIQPRRDRGLDQAIVARRRARMRGIIG